MAHLSCLNKCTAIAVETQSSGNPLFLVLFVLVFVAVIALMIVQRVHRRQGVKQFAAAHGWAYADHDDTVLQQFTGWPFTLGFGNRAKEVVRGDFGNRPAIAFRFEFLRAHLGAEVGLIAGVEHALRKGQSPGQDSGIFGGLDPTLNTGSYVGTGEGVSEQLWTLFAIQMPQPLPGVLIRFQMWTDRFVPDSVVGDLNLWDDEFNRRFLVRAEYPKLAQALLTAANQELLLDFNPRSAASRGGPRVVNMTNNPAQGFHLWTAGDSLIALSSAPAATKGLDRCFEVMSKFLDNVPADVWTRAAGAPSQQSPTRVSPIPPGPPDDPSPIPSTGPQLSPPPPYAPVPPPSAPRSR